MFIWFAALASHIWAAVAGMFAKKAVMASGSIAAGVALMLQLSAALNVALAALVLHLPDWAANGVAMFVPSTAPFCMSAILTALGSRWAYNFAMRSIDRVLAA